MGFLSNISPKTQLHFVSRILRAKVMQIDLPNSPHVNRRSVLLERKKQLWWAVPSRDNETSVVSHRFAVTFAWLWRQAFVVPGKTEVCNL
jgi:hypothetical protein